jgi:hypothetical protein
LILADIVPKRENPISEIHPLMALPFKVTENVFDLCTDIAAYHINLFIVFPIRCARFVLGNFKRL